MNQGPCRQRSTNRKFPIASVLERLQAVSRRDQRYSQWFHRVLLRSPVPTTTVPMSNHNGLSGAAASAGKNLPAVAASIREKRIPPYWRIQYDWRTVLERMMKLVNFRSSRTNSRKRDSSQFRFPSR